MTLVVLLYVSAAESSEAMGMQIRAPKAMIATANNVIAFLLFIDELPIARAQMSNGLRHDI